MSRMLTKEECQQIKDAWNVRIIPSIPEVDNLKVMTDSLLLTIESLRNEVEEAKAEIIELRSNEIAMEVALGMEKTDIVRAMNKMSDELRKLKGLKE